MRHIAPPTNQQAPGAAAKSPGAKKPQPTQSRGVDVVLRLQRSVGNHAVEAMLRASGAVPPRPPEALPGGVGASHDEEDEALDAVDPGSGIMRKPRLEVGPPDDPFEDEADRVAEHVVRAPESSSSDDELGDPDPEAAMPGAVALPPRIVLQSKTGERGEDGAPEPPPVVGEVLSGPGQPLDDDTRAFMEERFGREFRQVRLHTGGRAEESAQAVNATAFTVGPDLVFGAGAYSPGTASGKALIAHELTHVVQQGAAPPLPGGERTAVLAAPGASSGPQLARKVAGHGNGEVHEEPAPEIPQKEDSTSQAPSSESAAPENEAPQDPGPAEAPEAAADAREAAPSLSSVEEEAQRASKEAADAAREAEPAVEGSAADAATGGEGATGAAEALQPDAAGKGDAAPAPAQGEAAPEQKVAGGAPGPAPAPDVSEPPAADPEGEADAMDLALAAAAGSPQAVEDSPAVAAETEPPVAVAPAAAPEAKQTEPEPERVDSNASSESGAGEAAAPPAPAPPGFGDLAPVEASDVAATEAVAQEAAAAEPEQPDVTPAPDTTSPAPPIASPAGPSSAALDAEVSSLHPQSALDEVGEHAATGDLLPAERSVAMDMLAEEGRGGAGGSAEAGGGGGGGGGGAVAPAKPAPAPPDVSGSSPADALAQVAQLEPAQLGASLGGLKASVQHDVGERRTELAAAPPTMQRPIGSPITKADAPPPGAGVVPSGEDPLAVASAPKGADVKTPAAKPVPEAPPTLVPPTPQVAADAEGKMSNDDAARMQSQLARMSTRVQGVPDAGAAPNVSLIGNANPQQMRAQHDELRDSLTDARVKGAKDAATPLGEHALYPDVPAETLTAALPAGGGGAAPTEAAGAAAVEPDDPVAIIAREEKGAEVAGAVQRASAGVSLAASQHATSVKDAETQNTRAIADEEAKNAAAQDTERKRAQGEVRDQRGEWSAAQTEEIRSADQEASEKIATTATDVEAQRTEADAGAQKEIDAGNEKAQAAREEGERKAEAEKARAKEESDGFFGWLASKAKAAFDAVKAGIKAALDFARKAIKAALDAAKKLATELIERARKWIVDKIKAAGDFLIALGDRVLANFPALRDKFRSAIQGLVAAAEDAINRLAEGLKKAVTALLDAWGAALDAALGLLEAGLMAAIDIVAGAVQGAIKFAKGVAEALGTFARLIADIAADPGGWLSNLGSAIIDGLKNHLWAALKQAAQEWFNAKLEGILSVGKTIWAIVTGQLGFGEIAKMAWQAILALLPPVLAQILIEKLVAMIVPAAGAILAIVEGLRAAWGTVSKIIAAIDTFVAFLKAVKGGNAGPQFARALASAAIVVLDFVANFLLLKLGKGLMKLGGKLKGIAKRLMKKRKAAGAPKRPKKGKAKGDKRGEAKKDPKKDPKKDKKESEAEKKRKILDRAVRELPPVIKGVLDRGVRGVVLKGRLLVWRLRYRLSALELRGGKNFEIRARVNPEAPIIGGVSWTQADIDELLIFVRKVADDVIKNSPRVQREARALVASEREKELATKTAEGKPRVGREVDVPLRTSHLGMAEGLRQTGPLARGKVRDVRALGEYDQALATARQQQPRFAPAPLRGSTQIVLEPSATGKGYEGGKYFEMAGRILPDADADQRGPLTALALEKFARTGQVAAGFTANQLHALRVTMFAAEHTRSPAAAVWGTMSLDLLKAGKTPEEILGADEKGGLHPLSPRGVGEDKKALEERLERVAKGEPAGKATAAEQRQIDREVKMLQVWLESLKDLKFDDNASDQQKKDEIKARIKRRMEDAAKEEPTSPEYRK